MTDKTKSKSSLDFESLTKIFTKICPDFIDEPTYEHATLSRRFAEQVIFEYSKKAKVAKAQGKDETWRLVFDSKDKTGTSTKYTVIISMYVTKPTPQQQPFLLHDNLQLTFKQASLLAVAKYCQMVPHLLQRKQIVLTPLAGAVFNQNDLPKLAAALDASLPELVMALISSCQTDGYYLEHSRCHIAVSALIKTVADPQMRASIVKTTIKKYQLQGKEFDMDKFKIYSKFVQSSSSSTTNRSSIAQSDEVDNLVSEIMAFNLTNDVSNKPAQPKKKILKCAAKFDNPTKK